MSVKNPELSVVIPVYNEEGNIDWFYEELSTFLENKVTPNYELIYVNDGSRDSTAELLTKVSSKNPKVQYISLARNFGKEVATTAGLNLSKGKAVIVIDGDGQHPPEVIAKMVELWKNGYQHVIGIRETNEKAGFVKNFGSQLYYYLARLMGVSGLVANSTDFRLIDRELVDVFNTYTERKRMTRALLDWSGFKTTQVTFHARARAHGVAAYNLRSLLRLAVNGYISATLKPLYFVGLFGLVITFLSALALIGAMANQFIFEDMLKLGATGTAYIALFVIFLVGLLMVSQGIVAAYVANIQLETQNRPLYIINKAQSVIRPSKGPVV